MVAPLPLPLVLRDALLAAGLGFLLGLCYRVLRLFLGSSKAACFVCDGAIFAVGAVVYRSAAAGVFASGVMRWYTAGLVLVAYGLVQKIFYPFFTKIEKSARLVCKWPFLKIEHYILCPVWRTWQKYHAAQAKKRLLKHKKNKKNKQQGLPNAQKVLYNSN